MLKKKKTLRQNYMIYATVTTISNIVSAQPNTNYFVVHTACPVELESGTLLITDTDEDPSGIQADRGSLLWYTSRMTQAKRKETK